MKLKQAAILALAVACAGAQAHARDEIKIVGSSTVYPFTAAVAKRLSDKGAAIDLKSTGTRAGFAAFCLGYGDWWPDVTGASRPMTETEKQSCANRGVTDVTEIKIGFDGIVVARSTEADPVALTRKQLFLGLAERVADGGALVPNSRKSWKAVDSALPDETILVYGPPPSSGTRDSFESLAMSAGCKQVTANAPVPEDLSDLNYCKTLRTEPYFVEAGEDDTLIVQALKENKAAFGIFGYSYAATNPDAVRPVPVDGVSPTPDSIADGRYPLSRPLYIYVKNNRLAEVPNLRLFLEEYAREATMGPEGYLAAIGLVALSPEERGKTRLAVQQLITGGSKTN